MLTCVPIFFLFLTPHPLFLSIYPDIGTELCTFRVVGSYDGKEVTAAPASLAVTAPAAAAAGASTGKKGKKGACGFVGVVSFEPCHITPCAVMCTPCSLLAQQQQLGCFDVVSGHRLVCQACQKHWRKHPVTQKDTHALMCLIVPSPQIISPPHCITPTGSKAAPEEAAAMEVEAAEGEEEESAVAMASLDIFAGCGGLSEGMHQVRGTQGSLGFELNMADTWHAPCL